MGKRTIHFKVRITHRQYGEPNICESMITEFIYPNWDSIVKCFPEAGKSIESICIKGDAYNGLFCNFILTYENISNKRPTEQELKQYFKDYKLYQDNENILDLLKNINPFD